jgi:hypothetical protein
LKNLPFDTIDTDADDIQALENIYSFLKEKFTIGLPAEIDIQLNQFEIFSNYPDASIGGILLINHPENGCYLLFVKVPTQIQNGRGPSINYYKYQVWAYATLRNNFGRVIIKRETFIERLLNVLRPVELKFEGDPIFNKNFNVIANDQQKALNAITPGFRNALKDIKLHDFTIEIVNSALLIGSINLITPQQTAELSVIASNLSTIK